MQVSCRLLQDNHRHWFLARMILSSQQMQYIQSVPSLLHSVNQHRRATSHKRFKLHRCRPTGNRAWFSPTRSCQFLWPLLLLLSIDVSYIWLICLLHCHEAVAFHISISASLTVGDDKIASLQQKLNIISTDLCDKPSDLTSIFSRDYSAPMAHPPMPSRISRALEKWASCKCPFWTKFWSLIR
jgi:hypothetical protein